jgi:hypothetical protein
MNNTLPNTACTGQVGVVAIFKHFSRFEFILFPGSVHAHLPVTQTVGRFLAKSNNFVQHNCLGRIKLKIKVRTIKIALGIFTFLASIYPFIIITLLLLPILQTTGNPENFGSAIPTSFFSTTIFYPFSQLALQVIYIILAVKNKQLSDSSRILFIIGAFFIPFIATPIYFIKHVWKKDSQLADGQLSKVNNAESVNQSIDKPKKMKSEISKSSPAKKKIRNVKKSAVVAKKSVRSKK